MQMKKELIGKYFSELLYYHCTYQKENQIKKIKLKKQKSVLITSERILE